MVTPFGRTAPTSDFQPLSPSSGHSNLRPRSFDLVYGVTRTFASLELVAVQLALPETRHRSICMMGRPPAVFVNENLEAPENRVSLAWLACSPTGCVATLASRS